MKCCQHIDSHTSFFADLPRQSPGNANCTQKILGAVRSELPAQARVLDLGAGTGEQTLTLLKHLPTAHVDALDKDAQFLVQLQQRVQQAGLPQVAERLQVLCADFQTCELPAQTYDLIWSEGALYFMGLPEALRHFKSALKPDGFFVFSSLTWLVDDPSREVQDYWAQHYPQMPTLMEQMNLFQELGYTLLEMQVLPETVWWESYYGPIQAAIAKARQQVSPPEHLIQHLEAEIEMYAKYGAEYSYVYYALQLVV